MEIELKLEEPCTNCDARGYNSDFDSPNQVKIDGVLKTIGYKRDKCMECGGKGDIMTGLGEKLILFVKRWS